MGFLDFLGKAYNVVEKVSAKSGNVMSSMANSTMTNSNLSSMSQEDLQNQLNKLEDNLELQSRNLERISEKILSLDKDSTSYLDEVKKQEDLEKTITNLKSMIDKLSSRLDY